ncbi:hypothetical protein [Flavihumibacter sp. UBA7668]|uniref:hypothetical protein n=1 Tax=Flavihumibacter sp. UBA7668 TaxID=1946542 RepID=UPI0025C326D3|nr:hypothetical protein [Flavihumibacter sp. UBA7668]
MKRISGSLQRESSINLWLIFTVEVIIYLSLLFFSNQYIITEEVLFATNKLAGNENEGQLTEIFSKSRTVSYFLIPVAMAGKLLFISLIIHATLIFSDRKLDFKAVFYIVLSSELIFILASLLRTIVLVFFKEVHTLDDIANYTSLSIAAIFPLEKNHPLHFSFMSINMFEVVYMLLLGFLVSQKLQVKFEHGMRFILYSYGSFLITWILLVSFIQQLYIPSI